MVLEKKTDYIDHDRLFKELIQTFFQNFIEGFFPKESCFINFSSVKFLEQDVFTDILRGDKRRIDILAEVKIKGQDQLILIHIEPQSSYQKEFHERMFIYCSRLYEKYRKPILPIAVFSYNDKRDVPEQFTIEVPTLQVVNFQYFQLHLIKKNWRTFIGNENPVAAALLSKMGYTKKERVQVKLEFLRMLSCMELNPAKMALLYGFFETYLKLNEKEEKQMRDEITKLPEEEVKSVLRLPNSYFERGIQKGKTEGKEEEKRKIAEKLLAKGMLIDDIMEVTGLSRSEIGELAGSE